MKVEVTRYRKPDGYATRYWAVLVDGELLAVMLYRKGAEAVARFLEDLQSHDHSARPEPYAGCEHPAARNRAAEDAPAPRHRDLP